MQTKRSQFFIEVDALDLDSLAAAERPAIRIVGANRTKKSGRRHTKPCAADNQKNLENCGARKTSSPPHATERRVVLATTPGRTVIISWVIGDAIGLDLVQGRFFVWAGISSMRSGSGPTSMTVSMDACKTDDAML